MGSQLVSPVLGLSLALVAGLTAAPALAGPTSLVLRPEDPGAPYEARYSQAVLIEAVLTEDGEPVAGEEIVVEVLPEGGDPITLLPTPTDGTGRTVARLTLVNGRHGGASFPAAEPTPEVLGHAYSITATFLGDVDDDDPACTGADAGPGPDGGDDPLCPSEDEAELFVRSETVSLELQPGNQVALGEELTLIATLHDPNGDAPVGGTAIDGQEEAPVQGASIGFYFDLDGNERPSADELLGRDETDQSGIATLDFVADPAIFPAGEFPQGLHVQFGGDDRYALAGAAGRITLDAGGVDPDRCVIETEPAEELIADGQSRILVRGILVDEANNVLGIDAPVHEVHFTTDHGTMIGEEAERDTLTGVYEQEMRVPAQEGDATITIHVDGTAGATHTITFATRGCACLGAPAEVPWLSVLLFPGLAWALRRRRPRL